VCGRPFDPADPATMNFGRPMGRFGRAALAPLGRPPALLAAVAAVLVWSTVRAPAPGWRFALIDLPFYARAWAWRTRLPPANWVDACYSAGLLFAALAALGWALRLFARLAAVVVYRVPRFQRGRFWCRSLAASVFLLAAFAGVGLGWPWRVGQRLAREWEFAMRTPRFAPAAGPLGDFGPTVDATARGAVCVYRAALAFGDRRQKLTAVKWVAERVDGGARTTALAALRDAARDERDPDVRDAAAYALAHAAPAVPGSHRLRIAEWGVWIAAGPLSLPMTREQIASIPPFVHATGDVADDLAKQIESPHPNIFKPVVHLTVDVPLAVDLQIMFRQGRPWFAYPLPDELTLELGMFRGGMTEDRLRAPPLTIASLDPPGRLAPLANVRGDFPWILPARRPCSIEAFHGLSGGGPMTPWQTSSYYPFVKQISGVGLRWHSLIVTPAKPTWLAPPPVPPAPKYAWWPRLCDVDCAWVVSRNEGDRFLYYDGPTLAATPVTPRLVDDRLEWTVTDHLAAWSDTRVDRPASASRRDAIYVEVASDKSVRAGAFTDASLDKDGTGGRPLSDILAPMSASDVECTLMAICRERGLTDSEAAGLIACWRTPFFETPGRRFLLVLSPADYDAALPLTARPAPTEIARVGIVLSELGAPE
jgi:hypothetical protein